MSERLITHSTIVIARTPPLVGDVAILTKPLVLDDTNKTDSGGRQESVSPFDGTVIIAQSSDRISSPAEAQKPIFPSTGFINFDSDFKQLDSLQTELGIKPGQRLSHDPAMERARYLRVKTEEERQAVKQGVIINMEKTLYERAFASQSKVAYYQDDEGKIFHPDFPGESFDIVLQRGLEYSKSQGFIDYEREVKEFNGWKQVMTTLFDPKTAIGAKEIVISGPGLKKGTAFTDNFVDIYTKTIDPATGKIIVVMTRFASEASWSKYKEIAANLDKKYFDVEQVQLDKEDIYFLERPIFIDATDSRSAQQLFTEKFNQQKRATTEEKTKDYLAECRALILAYAEGVCAEFMSPEQVRKTFRAVLNKFDDLRHKGVEAVNRIIHRASAWLNQAKSSFNNQQEEIDHYAKMPVKQIMVGCGLSADFSTSTGLLTSIKVSALNGLISVGTSLGLLESDSKGSLYFSCPACGSINKRPREGYVESCQNKSCPNPKAVRC